MPKPPPPSYQKKSLKLYRHMLRKLIDPALTGELIKVHYTYVKDDGAFPSPGVARCAAAVWRHRQGEEKNAVWRYKTLYGGFEGFFQAQEAIEMVRNRLIRDGISIAALDAAGKFDD
jgi:hypothetical protein